MRRPLRRLLDGRLLAWSTPIDVNELPERVLVIAPHPDDEVLGCGGLIAAMTQAHKLVDIVFMTDGAASHGAVDRATLVELRRTEALAASKVLGVDNPHIHFLDFPDGELANHLEAVVDELLHILTEIAPGLIVAPHPLEPPSDHAAAYDGVVCAVRRRGVRLPGLLYGVWLWDQFPWTNPFAQIRADSTRNTLGFAIRERCGWLMTKRFTQRLELDDAGNAKMRALTCHATQMSKAIHGGPTLTDVSAGDWLSTVLRPCEYFAPVDFGHEVGS